MAFIEWCNVNQGFIHFISALFTVFLTLVLLLLTSLYVVGTIWIGISSKKSLKSSELINELNLRPIIVFKLEYLMPGTTSNTLNKWVIANIGKGPAVNIRIEGLQKNFIILKNKKLIDKTFYHESMDFHERIALIGNRPNDYIRLFPYSGDKSEQAAVGYFWDCRIKYNDLLGNEFETIYSDGKFSYQVIKRIREVRFNKKR